MRSLYCLYFVAVALFWRTVVYTAPFSPPRGGLCAVALNGMMLVIGGYGNYNPLNDVWGSTDGLAWTNLNPSPSFTPARSGAGCAVFGSQVVLVGGSRLRDVWVSSTGLAWTTLGDAAFEGRTAHGFAALNGNLWVVAGVDEDAVFRDVWYSPDARNWIAATLSAGFGARYSMGFAAFQDRLWVVGGIDETRTTASGDVCRLGLGDFFPGWRRAEIRSHRAASKCLGSPTRRNRAIKVIWRKDGHNIPLSLGVKCWPALPCPALLCHLPSLLLVVVRCVDHC